VAASEKCAADRWTARGVSWLGPTRQVVRLGSCTQRHLRLPPVARSPGRLCSRRMVSNCSAAISCMLSLSATTPSRARLTCVKRRSRCSRAATPKHFLPQFHDKGTRHHNTPPAEMIGVDNRIEGGNGRAPPASRAMCAGRGVEIACSSCSAGPKNGRIEVLHAPDPWRESGSQRVRIAYGPRARTDRGPRGTCGRRGRYIARRLFDRAAQLLHVRAHRAQGQVER
jgi:hypothetical protein